MLPPTLRKIAFLTAAKLCDRSPPHPKWHEPTNAAMGDGIGGPIRVVGRPDPVLVRFGQVEGRAAERQNPLRVGMPSRCLLWQPPGLAVHARKPRRPPPPETSRSLLRFTLEQVSQLFKLGWHIMRRLHQRLRCQRRAVCATRKRYHLCLVVSIPLSRVCHCVLATVCGNMAHQRLRRRRACDPHAGVAEHVYTQSIDHLAG